LKTIRTLQLAVSAMFSKHILSILERVVSPMLKLSA